jgi:AmmeMemoRadiSam system protein B
MGGQVVPDYDFWRTPLGEVRVDRALVSDLESHVPLRWVRRDSEHSLEVQLPFLQTVLGEFSLVPIIMGDASLNACRSLGSAIADVVQDRQVLLVASTDLSHFHPDATARTLDQKTLQYILDYDPQGLVRALGTGEAHACGGGPVATVMFAAQQLGAGRAQLVKYANSSDVWDDRSRVVGYAAVALMR